LLIPALAWGQARQVSGVVKDATGEPIIGASVLEKGTVNGIITDLNGRFSLQVARNAILEISYVGYTSQAFPVQNRTRIDIVLEEDLKTIDEVVVIGYGTARKSDIAGAIASVDSKTIQEVPAISVAAALQGRIPGIDISSTTSNVGGEMRIRVRGERSLTADNNPLIVVDGIPFNGSLNDISPNDIKDIQVLKDASSTAIYGSRGANGVILISTNRGQEGQTATISYNGYYGVKNVLKKYDMYTGPEWVEFLDNSLKKDAYPMSLKQQAVVASGNFTDWQDLLYQPGYVTNHEVSARAGNSKGAYSLSLGYTDETAIVPIQSFTRYTLRTTIDQSIGSHVKIGLSSNNSFGITAGYNPMGELFNLTAVSPAYNADGSVDHFPLDGTIEYSFGNPLYYVKGENVRDEKTKRLSSFNSIYGEVKIIEGLTYRINLGLSFNHENYGYFQNGADYPGNPPAVSTATARNTDRQQWTIENVVNYNKIFAEKHRFTATALYSAEQSEFLRQQMDATDIAADYALYYNLGLGLGDRTINPSQQRYNKRGLLSYMGRIQYTYDDKYLLTATLRSDAASVLAPGHKWHTYPAFNVGWNINRESFLKDIESITQLKLRFGYGQTSNQSVSPYATLGGLSAHNYNFGNSGAYGYYVTNLPNSELGWEYTENYNYGLDFGLLNGRITGYLEYYLQKTKDVLLNVNLPFTSGVSNPVLQNVGSTQNQGLEFAITAQIIKPKARGDFGFDADFNLSLNRNKITALASGETQNIDMGWHVGHPINVNYNYRPIGIWQESEAELAASYGYKPGQIKVEDMNNDGKITAEGDRDIIGTLDPKFTGGFSARLSYKNFDFSMVSFFRIGGLFVSSRHRDYSLTNTGRRGTTKVDYWTPQHPEGKWPQPGNQGGETPDFINTLSYFDGGFLKIRTFTLGYTFQRNLLSQIGAKSARVYLTCQNPFPAFFSDFIKSGAGIDIESSGYGGPTDPNSVEGNGRQLWFGSATPPSRNFLVGVSVQF
jgi:TonB-linked SusC/RagA family outer membrane protein